MVWTLTSDGRSGITTSTSPVASTNNNLPEEEYVWIWGRKKNKDKERVIINSKSICISLLIIKEKVQWKLRTMMLKSSTEKNIELKQLPKKMIQVCIIWFQAIAYKETNPDISH